MHFLAKKATNEDSPMSNELSTKSREGKAEAKKKKKNAPWLRPHHKLVRDAAEIVLYPFVRLLYGAKISPLPEEERQYLVLMNHQTAFDQFFVGIPFKKPLYYVASEDLFSKGIISDLLRGLIAPIPIKKQTTDPRAVINCIKVAREGGSIAMAPEGNRTYDGRPLHINPTVAPLARKLGLPIAFFRIEGGYGVHPRWSDAVRRGVINCSFSRILEPEEVAEMTDEELYQTICRELAVDENKVEGIYLHKKSAEYLERAIYTCPRCGFAHLESRGDTLRCLDCGLEVRHTEKKELVSESQDFKFRTVADWMDYQTDLVSALDIEENIDKIFFEDTANLSEVVPYKNKKLLGKGAKMSLFVDKIVINEVEYPFDQVLGLTVLGKNKLNVYHDGRILQLKGSKRFCALKYVNFYNHYKNITNTHNALTSKEENSNGREFLGL